MAAGYFLSACGSASYVEQGGPRTATLSIDNGYTGDRGPGFTSTTATGSPNPMEVYAFKDPVNCVGKLQIHTGSGIYFGTSRTIQIPADNDFTLAVRGIGGSARRRKDCLATMSFKPLPGRRYLARYYMTPDSCFLLVGRQDENQNRSTWYVREPSYLHRSEQACRG